MKHLQSLSLILLLFLVSGCPSTPEPQQEIPFPKPRGKLFIIGGGARPPELLQSLIAVSGIDDSGYVVILPMASAEPDTSAYYAIRQFTELGMHADRFVTFDFGRATPGPGAIDSLQQARLIYLTGGDQVQFMQVVKGTPVFDALHQAYLQGATIAGTSAGAAVMSRKMITGDEYKHPEYTGEFRTIEAENIQIAEGLGFLPQAIVDQHFVYRMRMNRLITVAIEHPEEIAIGIDESTALVVQDTRAFVAGKGQVIVLQNPEISKEEQAGLLGARDLRLSIFLPGDSLRLPR